jgi:hypothetical protein
MERKWLEILAVITGFLILIPLVLIPTAKADCSTDTCWIVTQYSGDSYTISDPNSITGMTICLFYAGLGSVQVSDDLGNGATIPEAADGSFCYNSRGAKEISFWNNLAKPPKVDIVTYLTAKWNGNCPFCKIIEILQGINSSNFLNSVDATNGMLQKINTMNQKASMSIGGTEYVLGQNGTLFIKLLDNNDLPINNGFCSIMMYYPNKTIKFMDNSPATFLENGLYYKDFFVPNTEGLYIADASCIYADTVYRYNLPSENAEYDGNIVGGTSPQPLTFSEVDCVGFQTSAGGTYQNFTFNYSSIVLINLSAISQIDVNWVGQIGSANAVIQLYNFNTSSWNSLETALASTGITLSCGNNVYITRATTTNITSYVRNDTIKTRIFRSGSASIITDSMEVVLHNNGSVVASLRGSSEVHVSNFFNQSQFDSILGAINSVNETLNTTILNYLIIINGTTFQINKSLYNDYLSLLSAINSVNATGNLTLSYAIAINGSIFNLSQAELSHFQQVLAFLSSINYTLNTTLEYKIDLINGTIQQINQSQLTDYLSLLGEINSVNTTLNGTIIPYLVGMNSSIIQYLVVINGTTSQINQSQFIYYTNLLQAINSVNFTANTTLENKLDYLNNTVIPFLYQINAKGNTTLELIASINQSLLNDYLSLLDFLQSLNYTTNTTLELKLDMINGTVTQINGTLPEILQSLSGINTTLYNQLVIINGNILDLNSSEFQNFQQMLVLLQDLNFTTNTTLENKLDLINSTTWQSWLMLQNLTIGNVSVLANVNWTEGLPFIWNASGQPQINYTLLGLSNQGINLVVETLACIDNTTLMHTMNVTNCVFGQCMDSIRHIPETCANGCANNMCVPIPTVQFSLAISIVLFLGGILYLVIRELKSPKGGGD